MAKATYKDSGVDLEVYAESMAKLPRLLRRTHTPRVLPAEGGFAGLFSLDFPGKLFRRDYKDPVLVSCTDGVGTKVVVAQMANRHDTVGIDLVAMCVNDALCMGAEPLFFLDYMAMSHDDPERVEALVEGISAGCLEGDMALVGGETAIMPDVYAHGHYDLAGFCVGVAERDNLLDGRQIAAGDQLIGIASSGIHSNGYSLVRKIVFEIAGLGIDDTIAECGGNTVADVLLTPTRIYVKPIRKLLTTIVEGQPIHGIAHITGGGLEENVTRIMPAGRAIEVTPNSWTVPPVFSWLQQLGEVDDAEMARVFNMGVGLVLVVDPAAADQVTSELNSLGLESWNIGSVV
ncbi:phosphoribosylformylglycinamidine cyclo-ligase [Aeoliella mucimassa]|uniref:Phosphoribosylformylglycinamidine cyclo-ligase n=1 Tax=Aeoliella mucimassa TaxID=2527972 RepID=A0A518AT91_9BACT|nr:phosphoribosylformylglycinamidine cyclo-ligase [Aeoliella mucimassa]QDU57945.1 Phosphoribosylformylglycinamidine cyclo-ligase [Aeoliella mucimassa]